MCVARSVLLTQTWLLAASDTESFPSLTALIAVPQSNASCSLRPAVLADCCDLDFHGPRGNPLCFQSNARLFEDCCKSPWALFSWPGDVLDCFHRYWANVSFYTRLSGHAVDIGSEAASSSLQRPHWVADFKRAEASYLRCVASGACLTPVESLPREAWHCM